MIKHKRRSIRLKGYDYSEAGAYFMTICVQDRECLFGEIKDGAMQLNPLGEIVKKGWWRTAVLRPYVKLDQFVVMPNHMHGIIAILDVGAGFPRPVKNTISNRTLTQGAVTAPLQSGTLGQMVAFFKYQSTKCINELRNTPAERVWQRNYYERVIRDERELKEIRQYIQENPLKWDLDPENPARLQGRDARPCAPTYGSHVSR